MASESPLFSPQEVFASTFVNSVRIAKFHLTAGSSVYQIVALCIRNYPGTKHVGIPTETAFDDLIQSQHIKVIRSLLNITELNSFMGNIVFHCCSLQT